MSENDFTFNINILKKAKREPLENDDELERTYHKVLRNAHKLRSVIITDILRDYREQQENRYRYKSAKKRFIFTFFIILISVMTIALIAWMFSLFFLREHISNQDIIVLISSCITYLCSLISTFLIIVKYIFPSDEEKCFNELVRSIIESDTIQIKNEIQYSSDHRNNDGEKNSN